MALSDPSWRVKTRPCPFYQQGRCLFSDSCNFLHIASATVIPEISLQQQKDRPTSIQTIDSHYLPRVVVDSPSSAQSPTLSAPISSLLIALQLEPANGGHDRTLNNVPEPDDWSEALPTVVTETFNTYHAESSDDDDEVDGLEEEEGNWTAISDYDDSYDDSQNSSCAESSTGHGLSNHVVSEEEQEEGEQEVQAQGDVEDVYYPPAATHDNEGDFSLNESGLLSPIELSTLHLGPFRLTDTAGETASFDSGYADWKPPAPLLSSPPRSPSISSTFDLLSSPFGTHSSRVLSPRFSAFLGRSPVLSPTRTVSSVLQDDVESFDLGLDSPQDYYTALAEEHTVTIRHPVQPGPVIVASTDDVDDPEDFNDHPQSEKTDTPPSISPDITDAYPQFESAPSHPSTSADITDDHPQPGKTNSPLVIIPDVTGGSPQNADSAPSISPNVTDRHLQSDKADSPPSISPSLSDRRSQSQKADSPPSARSSIIDHHAQSEIAYSSSDISPYRHAESVIADSPSNISPYLTNRHSQSEIAGSPRSLSASSTDRHSQPQKVDSPPSESSSIIDHHAQSEIAYSPSNISPYLTNRHSQSEIAYSSSSTSPYRHSQSEVADSPRSLSASPINRHSQSQKADSPPSASSSIIDHHAQSEIAYSPSNISPYLTNRHSQSEKADSPSNISPYLTNRHSQSEIAGSPRSLSASSTDRHSQPQKVDSPPSESSSIIDHHAQSEIAYSLSNISPYLTNRRSHSQKADSPSNVSPNLTNRHSQYEIAASPSNITNVPTEAVSIRTQLEEVIRRSTQSPPHVHQTLEASATRATSSPSPTSLHPFRAPSSNGGELTPSVFNDTPLLAYLRSPAAGSQEDGDITNTSSLYDIYSDIASPRELIADSMRNAGMSPPPPEPASLSNSSTPSSSAKERVFTPPPPINSSNDEAPTSFSSPMTSIAASSLDKQSPQTIFEEGSDHSNRNSASSKKIPFGFRNSFAPHRSANAFARSSLSHPLKSVPRSPLHMHSSTSLSEPSHSATAETFPKHNTGRGLKPLRLSNHVPRSFVPSHTSNPSIHSLHSSGKHSHRSSISSSIVSSTESISNIRLLSGPRSPPLKLSSRSSVLLSDKHVPSPLATEFLYRGDSYAEPQSAPPTSWSHPITQPCSPSRASGPSHPQEEEESNEDEDDTHKHDLYDETIRRSVLSTLPTPKTAPAIHSTTSFRPTSLLTTPRPDLMFAIASDDVEQVRNVLEGGNVHPNDALGPLSALEFTLTNEKLTNKLDIVKMLLAYGADTNTVKQIPVTVDERVVPKRFSVLRDDTPPAKKKFLDTVDPATRYYVERADATHTKRISALIHRSFFRPLARVRYQLVGQDRALEQLFRVLSMQSRQISVTPMVVILCGPSGHGKSLLARKFGSLLDVPTHTVNMTTLRSTHDIWRSYSMSPYETPTTCTLAEFLINNEGKRCVVVLDEIEKADEKTLWSLLMPWELGRCAFEASSRHVDVRNVIWLGTSNIGHDLVFQHREARSNPDELMSREEYVELMGLLRPRVSERLGASIASRITTVLPFVPFTPDEKRAVAYEALFELSGDLIRTLASGTVDAIIDRALVDYIMEEGARSLSRAISNQLIDIL